MDFIKNVVNNKLDFNSSFDFEGGENENLNTSMELPFNVDDPQYIGLSLIE